MLLTIGFYALVVIAALGICYFGFKHGESRSKNPEKKKEDEIEIGQTWKCTHFEDNPFKETIIVFRKVIDIQGEYVQYIENEKDKRSDKKYWFVINSELVPEEEKEK